MPEKAKQGEGVSVPSFYVLITLDFLPPFFSLVWIT